MNRPFVRGFLTALGAAIIFIGSVLVFQYHVLYSTAYRTPNGGATNATHIAPLKSSAALQFEIATTTVTQEKGLSGRAQIPNNYAMLFVFPHAALYGFWMKDMLVPIDIIWLSDNGAIVGVEDSISPRTYPNVFYPPQPVKYVLEMRAGAAHDRGWKIGTVVALPLPY